METRLLTQQNVVHVIVSDPPELTWHDLLSLRCVSR